MILTPAQCRGARAMLGWTQTRLAEAAGVAKATLVDFERDARSPMTQNLAAIRRAIEAAGLVLIEADGGGRGIRFSTPDAEDASSSEGDDADQ